MDTYTIQLEIKSSITSRVKKITIDKGEIKTVKTLLDLGLRHEEQIKILKNLQDGIIASQSSQLATKLDGCIKCGCVMAKKGFNVSDFHSVFTDHKVKTQRQICNGCGWRNIPSVKALFGTSSHPDLIKLQCETGAEHTYRDAQVILNKQSWVKRKINNHEQIHHVIEKVGEYIGQTIDQNTIIPETKAEELMVQIDGGHLKDKDPDARSFEAMAGVIYRPENIIKAKNKRGKIISKHCAASALSDSQEYMIKSVLVAARKQGLSSSTNITALCDGADNCWNIANSLKNQCASFLGILDWFHVAMKFQNISLPKTQKKRLERVKWCLWHGNVDKAIDKINPLIDKVKNASRLTKLVKLKNYIVNNKDYIVNYDLRKDNNLAFTSNMAESTVESLINQRCKGHQHMRWTRDGVHKLLQIRSYITSNDWSHGWLDKIMGAMYKLSPLTI
tara:strand:- start:12 stop:1352 length:1341 start_codon:yes stop_codon:yes gene_type:complete